MCEIWAKINAGLASVVVNPEPEIRKNTEAVGFRTCYRFQRLCEIHVQGVDLNLTFSRFRCSTFRGILVRISVVPYKITCLNEVKQVSSHHVSVISLDLLSLLL